MALRSGGVRSPPALAWFWSLATAAWAPGGAVGASRSEDAGDVVVGAKPTPAQAAPTTTVPPRNPATARRAQSGDFCMQWLFARPVRLSYGATAEISPVSL